MEDYCTKCGHYCERDFLHPVGDEELCPECYQEHMKEAARKNMEEHFRQRGGVLNPEQYGA